METRGTQTTPSPPRTTILERALELDHEATGRRSKPLRDPTSAPRTDRRPYPTHPSEARHRGSSRTTSGWGPKRPRRPTTETTRIMPGGIRSRVRPRAARIDTSSAESALGSKKALRGKRAADAYLAKSAQVDHYDSRNIFIRPLLPAHSAYVPADEGLVTGVYQNPRFPAFTVKRLMNLLEYSWRMEGESALEGNPFARLTLGDLRTGAIYNASLSQYSSGVSNPRGDWHVMPGDYLLFFHDETRCTRSMTQNAHLPPFGDHDCVRPLRMMYRKDAIIYQPAGYTTAEEWRVNMVGTKRLHKDKDAILWGEKLKDRDRRCLLTGFNHLHHDSRSDNLMGVGLAVSHIIPKSMPLLWTPEIQSAIYRQRGKPDEKLLLTMWCLENGIMLRSDLEKAFDRHHWTVDPETMKVVVVVPDDHLLQFHGQDIFKYKNPERFDYPVPEVFEGHFQQTMLMSMRPQPTAADLDKFPVIMPGSTIEDSLLPKRLYTPRSAVKPSASSPALNISPRIAVHVPTPIPITEQDVIERSEIIRAALELQNRSDPFQKLYLQTLLQGESVLALVAQATADKKQALDLEKQAIDRELGIQRQNTIQQEERAASHQKEYEKKLEIVRRKSAEYDRRLGDVEVTELQRRLEDRDQKISEMLAVIQEFSESEKQNQEIIKSLTDRAAAAKDRYTKLREQNEKQVQRYAQLENQLLQAEKEVDILKKRVKDMEVPAELKWEDHPLFKNMSQTTPPSVPPPRPPPLHTRPIPKLAVQPPGFLTSVLRKVFKVMR